jgi:hypothetical protein
MRHIPIAITFCCVLLAGLAVPSTAQPDPKTSPCEQITAACQGAGFTAGGTSTGNGLHVHCINPIMQGTAQPTQARRPLPDIDSQLVASCKASNPRFGQGSTPTTNRAVAATASPSIPSGVINGNGVAGSKQQASCPVSNKGVSVQAVAAAGAAAAGNNDNADILVLVTDSDTGAAVSSLKQSDFGVSDYFGVPGQRCGFSGHITSFDASGAGAYQITVGTHSEKPPTGGCKWVKGDYLGQVQVNSSMGEGHAAFLLSIGS